MCDPVVDEELCAAFCTPAAAPWVFDPVLRASPSATLAGLEVTFPTRDSTVPLILSPTGTLGLPCASVFWPVAVVL